MPSRALFHLIWRRFYKFETCIGDNEKDDAASHGDVHGGFGVGLEKELFYGHTIGLVLVDEGRDVVADLA